MEEEAENPLKYAFQNYAYSSKMNVIILTLHCIKYISVEITMLIFPKLFRDILKIHGIVKILWLYIFKTLDF